MQEFIVNVYVSLIRLKRNNYQDFALPLYPSQSCTRHNIQASLMFCTRLQRLCTQVKAAPLTPTLIYWKQYKVYIT